MPDGGSDADNLMNESRASADRPPDPGDSASAADTAASEALDARSSGATRVVPVVAETLEIERRTLPGAVRLRKRIEEMPTSVDETFSHDVVEVERVPVGRALQGPAEIRQDGDTLIVPVVEEQLVVEKRLVLTEELHIRRRTETRLERQRTTLRREHVIVERYDARTDSWSAVETPLSTTHPAPDGSAPAAGATPSTPAPSPEAPSPEAAPPRRR